MKKIVVLLIMVLLPAVTFAQKLPFDKFDNKEGVDVIVISKKLVDLAGEFRVEIKEKDTDLFKKLTEKMDELKVYVTKVADVKDDLKKEVKSYLKKNNVEALMTIKKDGREVKIYAKQPDPKTIEE